MASALNQKNSVFLLCLLLAVPVSSQNLLKNPSFEQFEQCPQRLGNFHADVVAWSTPTDGSTDYFNACSTSMGTPENFNGKQPAEFGVGYAGLYLYAPEDYREYLQAELTRPLLQGEEYQVSFFVSLAERSDYAIKEFGVLFAKDRLGIPIKKELSKSQYYRQKGNVYTYMEIGYSNFYDDTQTWIPVTTRFTAKGGERFMILGNFKKNDRTRKFKTKYSAKKGAYYYIDAVEVKVAGTPESTLVKNADLSSDAENKNLNKKDYTLDKIYVFENVLFDFDHYEILGAATRKLKAATRELNHIWDYLKKHPDLKIAILGHTDTVGTDSYNRALAAKRAKAVADHLIKIGLPKDRISWQGFGGQMPIASNRSAEGRRQNRRVEFVISNRNTP